MNDAQTNAAQSLLRTMLALGAGIAVGRGWVTTQQSLEISGALFVLIPAVWGYWNAYRSERETQIREHAAVQAGALEVQTGNLKNIPAAAIGPMRAQDIILKLKESQQ